MGWCGCILISNNYFANVIGIETLIVKRATMDVDEETLHLETSCRSEGEGSADSERSLQARGGMSTFRNLNTEKRGLGNPGITAEAFPAATGVSMVSERLPITAEQSTIYPIANSSRTLSLLTRRTRSTIVSTKGGNTYVEGVCVVRMSRPCPGRVVLRQTALEQRGCLSPLSDLKPNLSGAGTRAQLHVARICWLVVVAVSPGAVEALGWRAV